MVRVHKTIHEQRRNLGFGAFALHHAIFWRIVSILLLATSIMGCGQIDVPHSELEAGPAPIEEELLPDLSHPADETTDEASVWQTVAIGFDPNDEHHGEISDSIVIRASGADVWGEQDAFVFVYTTHTGNGSIMVRLDDFEAAHEWSKAGIMIREDLAPDSRNVFLHTSGENGAVLQARRTTGGTTSANGLHDPTADTGGWMRLTRNGDTIHGELSHDGDTWRELGSHTLTVDDQVLIGLAVAPNAEGQTVTASFSHLTLKQEPTPEPTRPTPNPPGTFEPPPATLYVAPSGNDANSGRSIDAPLRTLTHATNIVKPGDVVYIREGIYPIEVRFRTSGTPEQPIIWTSYPGERAILDGSDQTPGESEHRMWVTGAAWNVFANFEVRNGPRQGIHVTNNANDNVFHGIVSHSNHGSGIHNYSGNRNRYEYIIVHNNYDFNNARGQPGQDANGIGFHSGNANVVYRVISFNNSDDGIDAWRSTNTLIDESISFNNGRGSHGNGNGIKAGGDNTANHTIVRNSISFNNASAGITFNSGRYITFYNNTSFNNRGPSFVAHETTTLRNNIGIGDRIYTSGSDSSHNSWDLRIDPRFISTNPSHEDFLSLHNNSPAINAGTDIGLPYQGTAPDLGALPYLTRITDIIDPNHIDIHAITTELTALTSTR